MTAPEPEPERTFRLRVVGDARETARALFHWLSRYSTGFRGVRFVTDDAGHDFSCDDMGERGFAARFPWPGAREDTDADPLLVDGEAVSVSIDGGEVLLSAGSAAALATLFGLWDDVNGRPRGATPLAFSPDPSTPGWMCGAIHLPGPG